MRFIQSRKFDRAYPLLLVGGDNDKKIVELVELCPVLHMAVWPKPVLVRRRPNKLSIPERYRTETYTLHRYHQYMGDFCWQYWFMLEENFRKSLGDLDASEFIYNVCLSDTYVRRQYAPDPTWAHNPDSNPVRPWYRKNDWFDRRPINHWDREHLAQNIGDYNLARTGKR